MNVDVPTCKTCPYGFEFPNVRVCVRHAPRPSLFHNGIQEPTRYATWPEVGDDDTCGEHPKFPAYIAHLEANESK